MASRGAERERLLDVLRVLERRTAIVSWAIFFSVLSAVLICAVVVLLFSDPFTDVPLGASIAILFMASIVAIGIGFSTFLVETRIASRAARIRAELLEHPVE